MAIRAARALLEGIRRHGEEEYPFECCGFLLGLKRGGVNLLYEVYWGENEWRDGVAEDSGAVRGSKRDRYWITPEQYTKADRYARGLGLGVIGYYHSHPDRRAVPSAFDLAHSCWPGESYVIVSVEQGKAKALNSFAKLDYTSFVQEEILVED